MSPRRENCPFPARHPMYPSPQPPGDAGLRDAEASWDPGAGPLRPLVVLGDSGCLCVVRVLPVCAPAGINGAGAGIYISKWCDGLAAETRESIHPDTLTGHWLVFVT